MKPTGNISFPCVGEYEKVNVIKLERLSPELHKTLISGLIDMIFEKFKVLLSDSLYVHCQDDGTIDIIYDEEIGYFSFNETVFQKSEFEVKEYRYNGDNIDLIYVTPSISS